MNWHEGHNKYARVLFENPKMAISAVIQIITLKWSFMITKKTWQTICRVRIDEAKPDYCSGEFDAINNRHCFNVRG